MPTSTSRAKAHGNADYQFYVSSEWRELSTAYRDQVKYCEVCKQPADVTDHVIPIQMGGARKLVSNFMALCHRDHNSKRGREAHGFCVDYRETLFGRVPINRAEVIRVLRTRKW